MELKSIKKKFDGVLTLVLTIAALAVGQSVWAASTFTVTNTSGTSKFVITRTSNTSATETVNYRTVSLSAIAGQHFTDKTGTLTFDATHNSREVEVTENTPGTDAYKYQNGTSRKYRFEVLDQGGFRLAYTDRTITTGTNVPSSGAFSEKEITIYTDELQYSDAGYNQSNNPHYIESSDYYTLTGIAPAAYYTLIGAQLRSTLSLDAAEKNNGYQYVQILINDNNNCDKRAKTDGDPGTPSLSRYMAGFDHDPGDKNTTYAAYTFPVTSQPDDNTNEVANAWNNGVENKLYKQRFNTNCRATDGRLILPVDFEKLVVRFNASGGGNDKDEWWAKNVKAHIQAVDGTTPSRLGDPVISGSMHAKGNTFYVSVPFDEIVTVTGTPTLSTTWGNLSYTSGSGSNVLTFSGTITESAGTALTVNSISGTIKDLAGNELSSAGKAINKNIGTTVDANHTFTITYDHAGGAVATANPDSYNYETEAFTLKKPIRVGYAFAGWTGSNGNTPQTTVTIPAGSHGDKTFTANWTPLWGQDDGKTGEDEDHAYVISSTAGLDMLAKVVNGTDGFIANDFNGKFFKLGADITYSYEGLGADESNFTAIGGDINGSFRRFFGTFDGDNKTISGIRIRKGGDDCQGLFGYVSGGTIKNVTLTDADITGKQEVGGIVGYILKNAGIGGIIENCHVTSSVTIHAVADNAYWHGGIVGDVNGGSVSDCTSAATLTVADGLTNCSEYGGIVGALSGDLQNCLVVGANVSGNDQVGAVAGSKYDDYTCSANYYHSCTVNGTANATGVGVGSEESVSDIPHDRDGVRSVHTLTLPTDVTASGESVDIDNTTYYAAGTTVTLRYSQAVAQQITYHYNDGSDHDITGNTFTMPASDVTISVTFTAAWSGAGTKVSPYLITTPDQLDFLAKMVNGTDGYTANDFSGTYFKLGTNIDYTGDSENYTAIGSGSNPFNGIFNGDGKVVSGIRINQGSTDYQGLFGHVGSSGTVKNVILADAVITGGSNTGAVVGNNAGTLSANYYHDCTVNNQTTNIGTSSGDCDGARSVHTLTLETAITATGESVEIGPNTYYASNTAVTLGYSQAVAQQITYHYNDGSDHDITGNTFTMPASNATISVTFTAAWSGGGTSDNPYLITTTDQLDLLAKMVNGTDGYTANNYSGTYFKLDNDIEYHPTTEWNDATSTEDNYTAIGRYYYPFEGVFDGGDHTISGIRIYMSGSDDVYNLQGLFGVTFDGTVKNVTLTDARITGYKEVGGIIGEKNYGLVENCHVTNTVAIHAVVNNSWLHGGIVGYSINGSNDKIRRCTSAATISIADGLSGCDYNGGIVGQQDKGTIENCLASGANVSGNSNVGAIVGNDDEGSYTSNYYHGCTVNGTVNAINVGTGNNGDIAGARSVHTLTLGSGITATGESVEISSTTYYAAGTTVTLGYTGTVPANQIVVYSVGTEVLSGNSFTMTAADATVSAEVITEWEWLNRQLAAASTDSENPTLITLDQDYTAQTTDGYLTIPSGHYVTLDLNGHTLNRNLAAATTNGYVLLVNGTLTINDNSNPSTGTITGGNSSSNYGGVCVDGANASFTLTGGSITNNTAKFDGGVGIVHGGSFTLSGGAVSHNTMTNGTSNSGSGVSVYSGCTFTMTGGSVTGNAGAYGVYINDGTFTLSGGTVSNHKHGGVYIIGGSFTLSGGSITGNTATYDGGGVYVTSGSTFTMTGGSITGNTCGSGSNGGGVYVYSSSTFQISGSPVITGNTEGANGPTNNVYLNTGKVITVTDALTTGACIGVRMQDNTGVFTSGLNGNGTVANFTCDNSSECGVYLNGNGEASIIVDVWGIPDGADGSEAHPYNITTTRDLDLLATRVNSGMGYGADNEHPNGFFFQLGADITYIHKEANEEGADTEDNYTAIGASQNYCFRGTFDGKDHTISGIRIYKGESNFQGLFGYVIGGKVKNVTLSDAHIIGKQDVGGIVGFLTYYDNGPISSINNCHVDGTVTIQAVVNSAESHGGIAGASKGSVSNCTSSVTFMDSNGLTGWREVGGIVGYARGGTISNCLAVGVTIPAVSSRGAIVGVNAGSTLTANYYLNCTVGGNTTNVGNGSVDPNGARSVHSLTLADGVTASGESVTIGTDTYYASNTNVSFTYNGSIPRGYVLDIKVKDANNNDIAVTHSNDTYTFKMPACDASVSGITDVWGISSSADGSEAHPYIITSTTGLDLLAKNVNGIDGYTADKFDGKFFKLGNDITYAHTTDWNDATSTEDNYTSIGIQNNREFWGTFDGDGHTISGIRIYKGNDNCQGLFGFVRGMVKNITLSDARITGNRYVGGIVGYLTNYTDRLIGTVNNCHVDGNVAIHTVVSYAYYHGGIVGYSGTILNCTSQAVLTVDDNLTNCDNYGGIVGQNDGNVSNCISSATIIVGSGVTKSTCYGGIIGQNKGSVSSCLAIGATIPNVGSKGAIAGRHDSGSLATNYYYNCTIGDVSNATSVGVGTKDINNNNNPEGAVAATILSESETVPSNLDGKVAFRREFTGGKASTVCLPFALTDIKGGKAYEFVDVTYDAVDGWVATMNEVTATVANKPYLFLPEGSGSVPVLFHGTAGYDVSGGLATTSGDWTFTGTYTNLTYGTEPMTGHIYGFASKSKTVDGHDVEAGQFVHAKEGASVPPMRCYLTYKNGAQRAPMRASALGAIGTDTEVPSRITVRLVSAGGTVTAVGTLDTVTGEMDINTWYDMNGRLLETEPTAPGLYIHNGKTIMIKK